VKLFAFFTAATDSATAGQIASSKKQLLIFKEQE
jgi:hypothetical protein